MAARAALAAHWLPMGHKRPKGIIPCPLPPWPSIRPAPCWVLSRHPLPSRLPLAGGSLFFELPCCPSDCLPRCVCAWHACSPPYSPPPTRVHAHHRLTLIPPAGISPMRTRAAIRLHPSHIQCAVQGALGPMHTCSNDISDWQCQGAHRRRVCASARLLSHWPAAVAARCAAGQKAGEGSRAAAWCRDNGVDRARGDCESPHAHAPAWAALLRAVSAVERGLGLC